MGGPLLPGERPPLANHREQAQLSARLGWLEIEWRHTAHHMIERLPQDDDLRLSLIRTLRALDEC
jgi:hypothetical protein